MSFLCGKNTVFFLFLFYQNTFSVNLAFHPGMTNDIVFDGQMNTHRRTKDGKAAIIFDGKYYVSALRFITGTKQF